MIKLIINENIHEILILICTILYLCGVLNLDIISWLIVIYMSVRIIVKGVFTYVITKGSQG